MFATVFAETGIVVAAFLPGDSLLFAVGTFAGAGHLEIVRLVIGIHLAAVLGDSVTIGLRERSDTACWSSGRRSLAGVHSKGIGILS